LIVSFNPSIRGISGFQPTKLLARDISGLRLSGSSSFLGEEITGAEMKEFFTVALKLAVEKKCVNENDRVILSYEIFKKTREKIGAGQRRLAGFGR